MLTPTNRTAPKPDTRQIPKPTAGDIEAAWQRQARKWAALDAAEDRVEYAENARNRARDEYRNARREYDTLSKS